MARQAYARQFYPEDCASATRQFINGFRAATLPVKVVAAIVPHAGWQYSGRVAAEVFESIRQKQVVDTFVIFGAVHRAAGINGIYAQGAWATPLGDIEINETLASAILEAAPKWIEDAPAAHNREHSIEVELPFIKTLFPEAGIVPIAVNSDLRAEPLGRTVGEVLREMDANAVVIGSTDLTHYGPAYSFTPAGTGPRAHDWLRENDSRVLRLAEEMRTLEVMREALRSRSACGPGAIAATIAAASVLGAQRGYLVDYKTSYDVVPDGEFSMGVGYAGILY